MGLSAIKKHLKIYFIFLRFSLILGTQYRVSFFIEVLVEIGYNIAFLLFFHIIYGNLKEIAGWNYQEILFLTGLNMVASELILGMFYVFNFGDLPAHIKDGTFDFILLKPLNSLFTAALQRPYFASFLSAIPGIGLMVFAFAQLNVEVTLPRVLGFIVVFICGVILCFSVLALISSLAFKFVNADEIPRVGQYIITEFKQNPFNVYTGILRIIFMLIFPVVFISSVPASILIKEFDLGLILWAIGLAAIFLILTINVWNRMLRHYSSASS